MNGYPQHQSMFFYTACLDGICPSLHISHSYSTLTRRSYRNDRVIYLWLTIGYTRDNDSFSLTLSLGALSHMDTETNISTQTNKTYTHTHSFTLIRAFASAHTHIHTSIQLCAQQERQTIRPGGIQTHIVSPRLTLNALQDKGYFPEAVVNFVAMMGWSPKGTQEIFSMQELVSEVIHAVACHRVFVYLPSCMRV